jgi:acetyltransferase-like isoleucine patch superfamily enzyme
MAIAMETIKKIYKKIKYLFKSPPSTITFYTKDFFAGRKFIVGDFSYGNPEVLFENDDANLIIGKFCSIATDVVIFLGGNHKLEWISTYPFNVLNDDFPEAKSIKGHPVTKGNVIIGNDVWIGRGVTIMSGLTIGNGAVIAAGSVVTKNIGDYEVWGGNPAKFIKKRFTDEEIVKLLEIQWWNWDIEKIKKEVNYLCSKNI